jgi:erythromycin esterase-like protein
MWRNTEVKAFTHWLHQYNHQQVTERRVEFRGLDIYSLRNSIHEVLGYLDQVDPRLAHEARRRYGCLTRGRMIRRCTATSSNVAV